MSPASLPPLDPPPFRSPVTPQPDLCESAARLVWNAAMPFTTRPLLRAALIRPLGVAVEALNRLGAADKQFQVRSTQGVRGGMRCLLADLAASAHPGQGTRVQHGEI